MNSSNCGINQEQPRPVAPIGIRGSVFGIFLTLKCPACQHIFESYQFTVAGIAMGPHPCPQCRAELRVYPEALDTALKKFLPARTYKELAELTEEASRLAENWYRAQPLDQVLTYRGINLGEPTERWLAAYFIQGLLKTLEQQGAQ
jgi:hypothetical protein